jgi:hypothetical protein
MIALSSDMEGMAAKDPLIFLSRQISKVSLQLFLQPGHLPPFPRQLDVILPGLWIAGRSALFVFGNFQAGILSN